MLRLENLFSYLIVLALLDPGHDAEAHPAFLALLSSQSGLA